MLQHNLEVPLCSWERIITKKRIICAYTVVKPRKEMCIKVYEFKYKPIA